MKRLLLLVTAFGAWFASSAQLVDVVIEEFDPVSSGYSALYLPAAGQVTYRVYAEFGSPLDKVSALYGLPLIENAIPVGPCQQTVISTTTSWWNEAGFGTNLGSAMNCTFFGFVPALGGDSWLTIGAQCSADAGAAEVQAAVIDPPTLTPHFNTENGTSLVLNDGAVFTLFTSVSGFGTGPNNRVLLAQLTTDGEISFELNLQVFLQNDQAQEVRYVHSTACSEDATIEVDGSALGLIYPAPVQSVPGCTDPLACNYDINADTDDGTCILPDGCTDMAACNYDDTALCDDGSCDFGVSLDMFDFFGDGWDGATYTITETSDPLNPVFVASGDLDNAAIGDGGSFGTDFFCLADGCYNLTITAGDFPGEIDWTLNNVDGGPISGFAPADVDFTVNSAPCGIAGCTDSAACNYDVDATIDDGSCFFPPAEDECANAIDLGSTSTSVAGSNINACNDTEVSESSGVFYTFTLTDLAEVSIETSSTGANDFDTQLAIFESCGGPELAFNDDGGVGLYSLLTLSCGDLAAGTYIIMVDGFLGSQGDFNLDVTIDYLACNVILGCTDQAAINYNPSATDDDGSCVVPTCADAPLNVDYCYGNDENSTITYVAEAGNEVLLVVNSGTVEAGWDDFIVYDGIGTGGAVLASVSGSVAGITVESTTGALTIQIISDSSVSCQTGDFCCAAGINYDVYCGAPLASGCTDPTACNYDENAVVDDGSCIAGPCINDLPSLAYALPMNALGVCNGFNGEDIDAATVTAPEGQGFSDGDGRDLWYSFVPTTSAVRIEVNTADFDAIIELQDASNNLVDFEDVIFINGSEAMNVEGLTVGDTYYVRVYSWLTTEAPALFDICVQSVPASRCDYGPGPYSLCNTFKGQWVLANDYIFTFTSQTDGAEYVKQQGFANTFVQLFTVADLPWGDSYDVEVSAVFDLLDGAGNPESVIVETNVPCEISIIDQPLAQLTPSDNQANYGPHFLGNYVSATPWICSTVDWTWEFINTDGSQLPIVHQRGASNRFLRLSDVPGLQPGAVYEVRVKPEFSNGSVTGYGATQLLAIIGSAGMATEIETPVAVVDDAERFFNEEESNLAIYPNPNKGEFVNLNVTNIADGVDRITVDIYDTYGKLVISRQLATTGSQLNVIMPLDGIASGVYTVSIIVDGEVRTERMIVQK